MLYYFIYTEDDTPYIGLISPPSSSGFSQADKNDKNSIKLIQKNA
jgi:hypothetical protein